MLTAEYVRKVLDYNPETGVFLWRVTTSNKSLKGNRAGSEGSTGYRRMMLNGRSYKEHLIAWLYVTGEWPKDKIDHRDRVRDNNKWENLRQANNSQNRVNSLVRPSITLQGVHPQKDHFKAQIKEGGKTVYLGLFPTAEEAHEVFKVRHAKLHGEFSRYFENKS